MRAARYYGKEDIRVEEIEETKVGPGQVKIAPAFVGICGTDLHEYLGGPTFCPVDPHPLTGDKIPITIGHEFSGTVVECGPGVNDLEKGQNVCVRPTIACGECIPCTSEADNNCDSGGFYGLSGGDGGLADFAVLPRHAIYKLPDNVPLDVGALVEPLAVAMQAVRVSEFKKGGTAMVLGGGPIGLAVLFALKPLKPRLLITAEVSKSRSEFARRFGADFVIDPSKEDTVKRSRELCSAPHAADGKKGRGPDVVFDCAGVPQSIRAATASVGVRGTVVNVAIWEKPVEFSPNDAVFRGSNYKGMLGYRAEDYEWVLDGLRKGEIKPEGLITKRIKLEDLVEEGVKTLINDKENHVKILVDLNAK